VWGFAIVIAVNQIGIATDPCEHVCSWAWFVHGRWRLDWRLVWVDAKPPPQIVANWYHAGADAAPKLEHPTDSAQRTTSSDNSAQTELQRF
jgi:hypothetical protein